MLGFGDTMLLPPPENPLGATSMLQDYAVAIPQLQTFCIGARLGFEDLVHVPQCPYLLHTVNLSAYDYLASE